MLFVFSGYDNVGKKVVKLGSSQLIYVLKTEVGVFSVDMSPPLNF